MEDHKLLDLLDDLEGRRVFHDQQAEKMLEMMLDELWLEHRHKADELKHVIALVQDKISQ